MATVSDSYTQEVLRLTNEFRKKNGLKPLSANNELDQTAQNYSQTMADGDFFAHEGKDGSKPWDRAKVEGYSANSMGENIAAGQPSPQSVVDGWIKSPGHRANMLNPSYTELGVGYFNLENDTGSVNYNTYWTQLFGSGDLTVENSPESTPPAKPSEPTAPKPPTVASPEILIETPPLGPTADDNKTDDKAADPISENPTSESPTDDIDMGVTQTPPEEAPDLTPDVTTGEDLSKDESPPKIDMSPKPTQPEKESSNPDMKMDTDGTTGDMKPMDDTGMNDMDGMDNDMDGMDMDGVPHNETHGALDDLIESTAITHRAIKNGAWSDASTWEGGKIPGEGAKVLIAEGTTVTYDQESEARLETIAIDGNLKFATNQDTQLYVETIINSKDGKLDIGSESQAVAADKSAQIIFTSDRAVNTAWDPTQLSKGLVSHGEVNIYGAQKTEKAALTGNATAGNNVLTFRGDLSGWAVGDQIALGGTGRTYKGVDADNSRLQDEVLTITEISGNNIRFTNDNITTGDNTVLRYDHEVNSYADAGELDLYAANLTRNVSFETENGKDVPINQRAHVMLMHNPDVNVSNAGFYDLGRSDKSKMVDDIGENVDGSKGNGTNIRGRYALHLHKTGVEKEAAVLRGNVVSGSPGWGIVQHESNAGLEDNVVFDVVGAGIVAESGNEQGWWTDNLVMKTTGTDWKSGGNQREAREDKFDLGFEGDGYWIQGAAQIENKDNKAISSNRTGMVLFGSALDIGDTYRPVETIDVASLPQSVQQLVAAEGQTEIDIRDVPMADVTGFEAYNGTYGMRIWGHKTNFDGETEFSSKGGEDALETAHLGRSTIKDFKIWNSTWGGAEVFYSSNIDLADGLILAKENKWNGGGAGLLSNHATFNSAYDNLTIRGFEQGANIEYLNNDNDFGAPTLKNSTFSNNVYNLTKVGDQPDMDEGMRPDDYSSFVKLENNQFAEAEGNAAPVARFGSKAIGGLAIELDASASSDADPLLPKDGAPRTLGSKGIAAYGWDLNNDGKIDQFGRTVKPVFDKAGDRTVGLTVIDSQGAATTTTQTVSVQPTDYGNAFDSGNFSSPETQESWKASSRWADEGWYISDNASVSGGVADLSKPGAWGNHIGQVVQNANVHRGDQTLNFRLKNIEGEPDKDWKKNIVSVEFWGVDGQFNNSPWEDNGPTQVGALPMKRTQLVSENFGGENGEFFDWKNFSYDVNLGDGYDYLMFQVKGDRLADNGDDVAIDNVSLAGEANAIPGSITPVSTLNPRPKFSPSKPTAPQPPVSAPTEEEKDLVKDPIVEKPEAKDPIAEKPKVEDPTKGQPDVTNPPVDKPDAMDPIAGKPEVKDPVTDRPEAKDPMTDEPVVADPVSVLPSVLPKVNFPTVAQPVAALDASDSDLSPVVELSFEEGSGRLAKDTSTGGGQNDARLREGTTWTAGKVGGAIALNGESDAVAFKNSKDINLDIHGERTVSLWFKADDTAEGRKQTLYEEGGTVRGLNAYLDGDQLMMGGWNRPESQWKGSWINGGNVEAGKWHHAAIVLDGQEAITDNALTAYLDGQEVGQAEGSQLWGHPDRVSLGNVSGNTRFEDGIGRGGDSGLSGAIDEVKIFNSALTSDQIQSFAA